MTRLVAGVDSSTQSCTIELRSLESGSLVGRGRAPHPPTHPPVSEQDPHDWWLAFESAWIAAVSDARADAASIEAVAVAAQCHGLVVLDSDGSVIRPAKLWNDTTSAPQAAVLVEALGVENWTNRCGLRPTAALTISKLAWLAATEPDAFERIDAVLLPHDYLTHRLTGRYTTDRSDASGTGYFGLSGEWQFDLLDSLVSNAIDWQLVLPVVLGPDGDAGLVDPVVADQLGLGHDTIVAPGGGDQHLGAVGLGVRPGDIAVSLGTSGVVMSSSEQPVIDHEGWIDCVADATGGFLPLICTLNAAKVVDTMAQLLGVSLDELGRLAMSADPHTARPVLVPHFDGERTPPLPQARGRLDGLTNDTTREMLALSGFEGVVWGLGLGYERIAAHGLDAGRPVVVAGGGAASPAFRQVLADMFGREVVTRDAPDATARGAAIQAAAVVVGSSIADMRDSWAPPVTTTTHPRPGSAAGVPDRFHALVDQAGYERN